VTYEEARAGDMLEDEVLAPGVISSIYVTGAAAAPRGAWPFGVPGVYGIDDAHVAAYARAAKTREGFQRYLDEWVLTPRKSFSPA
jgi:glutaconate CoA-transferase subunit A